jgi:hypothetical protein
MSTSNIIKATNAPKIQKTNRIMFPAMTIYCSSMITREVRDFTIRCNQILAPKKGEMQTLKDALILLARKHPHDFSTNARNWLLGR